jgi:hypothetical protein
VLSLDKVFLPLVRVFGLSILSRSRAIRRPNKTQGPSTPQIIAFAMICSGRDDRVKGI